MARYPDSLLDDIRSRIAVSEVVGRRFKLRRQGHEFVAIDDKSLTVNDRKRIWQDFGKTNEGGDVFDWFQKREGLTFQQAVEEAARLAGVDLPKPNGAGRHARSSARKARDDSPLPDRRPSGRAQRDRGPDAPADAGRRKITATYDYVNGNEVLVYQVVRIEWVERGKKRKMFFQRRPAPDEPGVWINALDADEFIRIGPGKDWTRYDDEKWATGRYTERRVFDDDVAHTLYNLPAVSEEVAAGEDGALVAVAEGEKDAETLKAWSVCATTNSGGVSHWTQHHAELLRGADVVVFADNDPAGRDGAVKRCRALRGVARRVRLLDIAEHWPACPERGDVTDWRDKGGGTRDKLYDIIDRLPEWKPELKISKFGRVRWRDQDAVGVPYQFLIKGLIPRGEPVLIAGHTQTGKSFMTFDMAMHVARGVPYQGRRVREGLVIYCAMEAGKGFKKRMRAYRLFHRMTLEDFPFDLLTKKADLFSAEIDTDSLIAEIAAIAEERDMQVEVVVIDTYDAATPGMKEISSEDQSRTRQRLDRIRERFGCGIWIVHHLSAQGNVRGHTSLLAGIETSITVRFKTDGGYGKGQQIKDANGKPIREAWVQKQREGEDNWGWEFILPQVKTGLYDEDNEPETSCVVMRPMTHGDAAAPQVERSRNRADWQLRPREAAVFRALIEALRVDGVHPNNAKDENGMSLNLPGVEKVVQYERVKYWLWRRNVTEEEDKEKARGRIKAALRLGREGLTKLGHMGTDNPWVWWTGQRARLDDGSMFPKAGELPLEQDQGTAGDSDAPSGDIGDFLGETKD